MWIDFFSLILPQDLSLGHSIIPGTLIKLGKKDVTIGGMSILNNLRNNVARENCHLVLGSPIMAMLYLVACPPVHEGGTPSCLAGPEEL